MTSRHPGDREPMCDREPMWRRYRRLLRPDAVADLDDELRDHLDSATEALVAGGMAPAAAQAEARRRFGDVGRVRSEVQRLDARHGRSLWRGALLESIAQDLRYTLRTLRRSPGFAVVAILSIALGVAANGTVFSLANALLLRPIPGAGAPRLVRVYRNNHSPWDWRTIAWLRDHARSFDAIVVERTMSMVLGGTSGVAPERVRVGFVSDGYFQALAVQLALGHPFQGAEHSAEGSAPAVILAHRFWTNRFGADSSVVGRTIVLGGRAVPVAGVAAPEFRSSVLGWTHDFWLPLGSAPVLTGSSLDELGGSLYATGRLRPGVTRQAAQAELAVLMPQLAATDTARYAGMTARLDHVRGINAEMRTPVAAALAFLMALVALVLIIACANVANLLLGRAAARRTEIGVRLAIGAGRARLVRQLLTESMVLATVGGALGYLASLTVPGLLVRMVPAEAGLDAAFFAPDHRVVLFTVVLVMLTTVAAGLVPALRASSPGLAPLLRGGGSGNAGQGRRGSRLVAGQAALCVLLLAVASIFGRSLTSMHTVDPGFRADGVVDVALDLSLMDGDEEAQRLLFDQVVTRTAAVPGVQAVTLAAVVPLSGNNMQTEFTPDDNAVTSTGDGPRAHFNIVSPEYFETLKLPLRSGRGFNADDRDESPRVAVVNEAAARRWWPAGDAIGRRFRWKGADGPEVEIVGVAANADYEMPGESPLPNIYFPLAQNFRGQMVLQLRADGGVAAMREPIRAILNELAPTLPPPPVVAMRDDMAITLLPVRIGAILIGAFGLMALLLASAGIYGVTSYDVARRTREIGIRSALGATRGGVLRLVVGESLRTVAGGVAVGVGLALLVGLALSRVLYGVRALDPTVLVGIPLLLGAVSVVATLAPARRAAAVPPVSAMRDDG